MIPLRSKRRERQPIVVAQTTPAPWKGLNTSDPLGQMPKGYATTLQNWWPAGYRLETRPGCADHKTGFAAAVKSLCRWTGVAGTSKLFAVTDAGFYDATSAGAVGALAQARTEGRVQHLNFRTSAGTYLLTVNSTDSLARYDGSSWATDASYTITGGGTLTTSDIANLGAHQRRVWLVKKATADAYYFAVDAITGDVTLFPLGGLFTRGGHLLAIGTWSRDGGSGPEDYAVFVSSQGQVAIYTGTDPSSTSTFSLVGVYDVPPPLGLSCLSKLGPELLILTSGGAFACSSLLKGEGEQGELALTSKITPSISSAASLYGANDGWQFASLPTKNLLIINVPTEEDVSAFQFAQNVLTGAWCTLSGFDALCWEEMDGELYFGTVDTVVKGWTGYTDYGSAITAVARDRFHPFGVEGQKHWKLYRADLSLSGTASVSMGLDVDYKISTSFTSGFSKTFSGDVWDSAIWDTAVWGEVETPVESWLTPQAYPGYVAAVRLRAIATTGTVAWSSTQFRFEGAALF